jgi:hypothetical protein
VGTSHGKNFNRQLHRERKSANTSAAPRLASPDTPARTPGHVFPAGEIVEIIRETEAGPLTLLHSDGECITIAPCVEVGGQAYIPMEMNPGILRALTLPQRTTAYGSTDALFRSAQAAFTEYGFPESVALRATHFAFSTWFPDASPVAPCLLIVGPRAEADLLLALLSCMVRHAIVLGEITRDGLCALPLDFQLTLLTGSEILGHSALRLLVASNSRNAYVPWHGSVLNLYCAKAVHLIGSACDSFGDDALRINLAPSRGPIFLDPDDKRKFTEEFQAKFLAYRLANLATVRASKFELPNLPSGLRLLAHVLGASIVDAPAIEAGIAAVLKQRHDEIQASHWLDLRCVIIETLLFFCHDRAKERIYVGEVATAASRIFKGRGENAQLEPRGIGPILRSLSLSPQRYEQGCAVRLTGEVRRRVHQLARDYEVAAAQQEAALCPDCLDTLASAKKG